MFQNRRWECFRCKGDCDCGLLTKTFDLTLDCPYNCVYCYQKAFKRKTIFSQHSFLKFLAYKPEYNGRIILRGGEVATLRIDDLHFIFNALELRTSQPIRVLTAGYKLDALPRLI